MDSKISMKRIEDRTDMKYVVSFRKNRFHYCTGCLVSYKDILTSSYCVLETRKFKRISRVSEIAAYINEVAHEIIRMELHPRYDNLHVSRSQIYNLGHIEVGFQISYHLINN